MKKSVVYLFQAGEGGPIKIGHAVDLHKRYDQLQNGSAAPLLVRAVVEGGRDLEKALHSQFASYRMRGEWFQPVDDIFTAIAAHPQAAGFLSGRPLRKGRHLRMPVAQAETIWRDRSVPFKTAMKLMTGWSWKAATAAFGYRSGSDDPRARNGQDRAASAVYGKIGGRLTRLRVAREMEAKRMPKAEARNIWRNPLLTNAQALAQMSGWTQASAYRRLKSRKLAKGRPRSEKTET